MVRFTWHVVTIVLGAFGVLFTALALDPDANPKTLLLRWFAATWIAATATALWQVRSRPSMLVRFPVPLLIAAVAVMSFAAST
jgi:hypothetical protein